MRTILSLICISSLIQFGCEGPQDALPDDPFTCEIGATGNPGVPTLTQGTELELDARSTTAQNTPEIESENPLGPQRLGGLRLGECGTGAAAFVLGADGAYELTYIEVDTGTSEVIAPLSARTWPALFFDESCNPSVLVTESGGVTEYSRDGGTWASRAIFDPEIQLPGEGFTARLHSSDVGRDGRLYLFIHSGWEAETRLVRGSRPATAGSDWSFDELPFPEATEIYDYAVDSTGASHAVYRNTEYPCDPCNVTLYSARIDDAAGQWVQAVVQEGLWGDPNDELAVDATMVVDRDDRPIIAAQFQRRVVTGSLIDAALRVYAYRDDDYCDELAVAECDGYSGSDGTSFTGGLPAIEIDAANRLHVLFADLSVWHDSNGANTVFGQLRHAIRAGDDWSFTTLVRQPGQTESPQPLHGISSPNIAISADGGSLIVGAMLTQWDTNSIYNLSSPPLDIRGVLYEVEMSD